MLEDNPVSHEMWLPMYPSGYSMFTVYAILNAQAIKCKSEVYSDTIKF